MLVSFKFHFLFSAVLSALCALFLLILNTMRYYCSYFTEGETDHGDLK